LDPTEPQYDIKAQALNEIDINIHEAISASRGYQINPEPFLKGIITEAISELRLFTIQFDQADLAENQRDLFGLLKPDIETIIVLTEDIIELEDDRLALLKQFDSSRRQVSRVLDQEIQAIAIQNVQEGQEKTKDAIDQFMITLVVIFIITLIAGFAFATRLGKRLAKIVKVTNAIRDGDLDTPIKGTAKDEIGDLARSMDSMATQLKQVAKDKDEFASMITHELKTPLVPIQGFCEMLKDPDMGKLSKDQEDAVDEIYKNSTDLLHLIQNMLNAQKVELHQLKFNLEIIDVDEYMKGRQNSLQQLMKEKNTEFVNSTEDNLRVKADVAKLNEIFTNMIQNAIDFVPEEGSRIEMGAKSDGENVLFYVKDNGVGIPKDKIGNMFQKFYQADTSHTRKHGGSGLGLAICKGYIENMGGKIWLESEEGKGTTFFFTIPKAD